MRALLWVLLTCAALLPQERKLSPREIFYSAPPAPAAVKPAAKKARPAAKPAGRAADPAEPATAAALPVAQPETATPIVNVSTPKALGLRYSILKRTADGQEEVDAASVFHAGDRIRLGIEVNSPGHLYIVNRGSSGSWNVLFPSPEVAGGDNRVLPGMRYEIPSGYTFTFDERAGEEKLFIVLSRQPVPDLERLIYSLGEGAQPAKPAEPQQPKLMLASNVAPIDDNLVGRLRRAYSRDLIIEKVDEKTPGPRVEKAVYAVNPSTRADARVIADISLNHK